MLPSSAQGAQQFQITPSSASSSATREMMIRPMSSGSIMEAV
jgi:hypothetical protein